MSIIPASVLLGAAVVLGTTGALCCAAQEANYDEAKVPAFELPDPLHDGSTSITHERWLARRAELLELFQTQVYGRAPDVPLKLTSEPVHPPVEVLQGKALMYEVAIRLSDEGPTLMLLVVRPKASPSSPAFLGLNFRGNHSVLDDPRIVLSPAWMRDDPKNGYVHHRALESSRGAAASRWPVELLIDRGYALATMYYGDIDPDFDDGFRNGVHRLEAATEKRPGDAGGSIAAWAWGLSRAMDYLTTDPGIDAERVAVFGHSRLGKTALWAGATDRRFRLVISNDSGCGGAALSRREFGETVRRINTSFPHWFCDNFVSYNERVQDLPVDQHELIALIAPCAVYVASAEEDRWADPRGEFLSLFHAAPVYRLLGAQTNPPDTPPDVNSPWSEGPLAYHIREGKHDVTRFDWEQYLDFADRVMRRIRSHRSSKDSPTTIPGGDATTGLVPVGRCSSPTTIPGGDATTGLAPVGRCSSPTTIPGGDATTGLVPVGRCSSPTTIPGGDATTGLAPVGRCSSPTTIPGRDATTGLVPVGRCSSPTTIPGGDATTGLVPVGRCSSPTTIPGRDATTGLVPVGRCSSPTTIPGGDATTGLVPVGRCSSPTTIPGGDATTGLVPVGRCSCAANGRYLARSSLWDEPSGGGKRRGVLLELGLRTFNHVQGGGQATRRPASVWRSSEPPPTRP